MTYGGFGAPYTTASATGFAIPSTTVATTPTVGAFPFAKGFGGLPYGKAGVPYGKAGVPYSVGGTTSFAVPNYGFGTVPW